MKINKNLKGERKALTVSDLKLGIFYVCISPPHYRNEIVIGANEQIVFIESRAYLPHKGAKEDYLFREFIPGESFEVTNQ